MFSMYNTISLCILLSLLSSPTSSTTHLCSKESQCEGQRLICSSTEACYVQCSANWACRGTTIECPIGNECHVKCHYDGEGDIASNAQLLCQNMIIEAADSTVLIINASIGNQPNFTFPRTLESAMIQCPNNNNNNVINGDKPCQIYCDGDDLMRGTTIMVMGGTNDLFIESIHYSKRWCIRGTELKCGTNYSISCSLRNQPPFGCQDSNVVVQNQTCETTVIEPTTSPIFISETTTPSNSPSNQPTATPINEMPVDPETTEPDDGDKEQLTMGELIMVIIIPLCFCIIILVALYCFMLKHHEQERQTSVTIDTDDENVENGYHTKRLYDDDIKECKEEEEPFTMVDGYKKRPQKMDMV